MPKKQIKLKRLVTALKTLGFIERRMGSHAIFNHQETGLIVSLPMGRKDVPVVYLKSVFKQIVDRGIISEDDFWELLKL
jgi:predicted RNA binding protein YcfA (HicA-like mRNA interferase family)